jgi:hypothetical protein
VKLAAILLVTIGGTGLVIVWFLMRRNLERLRKLREEVRR